jgi:RimJ/RimL family protein N-acetyltransferase
MPSTLETARLTLTQLTEADEPELLTLYSREPVLRYVDPGRRPEKTQAVFARMRKQWAELGFGYLVARERGAAPIIGGGALIVRDPSGPIEVGYVLGEAHWGKGYATEIAARLLEWAFGDVGAQRVVAQVHPDNAASARVLRKLGFVFERRADGAMSDWYALERR